MNRTGPHSRILLLFAFGVVVLVIAAVHQLGGRDHHLPDDGVFWIESPLGLLAREVRPDSPATRAGIRPGDLLLGINQRPVENAIEITQELHETGIGSPAGYLIVREGVPLQLELTVGAEPSPRALKSFLQLIGGLYLLLGVFVLWRRPWAARSAHFYLYCLASFVLFAFSFTGQLNTLDWTVYWFSVAALLLQPALFAHFCLTFLERGLDRDLDRERTSPEDRGFGGSLRWTIYGTALLIGLVHVSSAFGVLRTSEPLMELRWWLDRIELGYLVCMYLLGIMLLAAAYRKEASRLISKQIAWMLGSAALALIPFCAVYGIPFMLGRTPSPWMEMSAVTLVFLPSGIAFAMVQHRLLDIEVALGRGIAYTGATSLLVGGYLGVAALGGDWFRKSFPDAGTIGLVAAVIATGLLFQPLQKWIQSRLDWYFLRHRYDYRETLLRLGRQIGEDTSRAGMIDSVLTQLTQALDVERAAVLTPATPDGAAFTVAGSTGISVPASIQASIPASVDAGFLATLREPKPYGSRTRNWLLFPVLDSPAALDYGMEQELGIQAYRNEGWKAALQALQLHYYFPCYAQNRLVAVLGLGKTVGGELLSDEDASLIETLAGQLGLALESLELLESLSAKARQFEDLQQFSENILESINVGLLAVDLEDRIEAVNSPLELMVPAPFRQAKGKLLSEILPPDLQQEFDRSRADAGIHHIYRYRAQMGNGEEKILNITIAPLLSKNCDWIGRLIVFDDVTDRVMLETQLAQSEKLSSVGLLAAGVAHEVNTPLTVISSQAQMLAKQLPPEDKIATIVDKIIGQTFRASEIVNSLLNFSRTRGAESSPVNINQITSETLLLLDHQFKTSRIEVETHLDPDLALMNGNTGKLQQVLLNILLNAKDAMPDGGRLRITSWTEDSTVRLEIQDNGVGISPENLPRIYDPFFTTKDPGRGTGLGLAVSYGIIHEHSGTIQTESTPGMGTIFSLRFPMVRKPVHA